MGESLAAKKIKESFGDLLQVTNANSGIDSTLRKISDGKGDDTAVSVATNKILVQPASDNANAFEVKNVAGDSLLNVDSVDDVTTVVTFICTTINGIIIAKGTTAQRPSLGVSDVCMYYDTDLALWIFWNGALLQWV